MAYKRTKKSPNVYLSIYEYYFNVAAMVCIGMTRARVIIYIRRVIGRIRPL